MFTFGRKPLATHYGADGHVKQVSSTERGTSEGIRRDVEQKKTGQTDGAISMFDSFVSWRAGLYWRRAKLSGFLRDLSTQPGPACPYGIRQT